MKRTAIQKTGFTKSNLFFNHSFLKFLKMKSNYFGISILVLASFAMLSSCDKGQAQGIGKGNPNCPPVELINNPFPKAQAEIKATLDELFKSIQDKDADKLISFHVYGPKFTEFKDSKERVGSAENEAYERGLVDAISAFDYSLDDLKIDVFGEVAVITFHADFRPTIGGNVGQIRGGVTLIFVKVDNKWKITHEHFSPLV